METIILIISTPFVIIGVIEQLTGVFSLLFHVHPSYRHLLRKGILLEDKTCSFFRSWASQRYWSLILTEEYLILKNSYLTSVANIPVAEIESYADEKSLLSGKRKNFVLYLKKGTHTKDMIKFCTKNSLQWEQALSKLGVAKRGREE